ncbi:MAG TPA: 50S ribosomal protein L25 [Pirellulales bacterium]|jgi:large subunit ribosomal protein L25|nr:50S ribosomal protein L25 [Pirellulales bacterium]
MAETLQADARDSSGKRNSKRLRAVGKVPAVLYGHGQKTVSLAIPSEQISAAVRHGSRVVKLKGAANDSALIRELQYDTFGLEILHVDFARVSEHERVRVEVPLEIRGQAAGIKEGGVIEHLIHTVEIECPVSSIPDKVVINVAALKLDDSMTVGQATLPEGAKIVSGADEIAVQCLKPKSEEDEGAAEAAAEGTVEPELIRKEKPAEDEEEKE